MHWRVRDLMRIQLGVALVLGARALAGRLQTPAEYPLPSATGIISAALLVSTLVFVYAHVLLSRRRATALALFAAAFGGGALSNIASFEPPVGCFLSLLATIGWGLAWNWFVQRPSWMRSLAAYLDRQAKLRVDKQLR